jgi:hypothetical protein
MRLGDCDSGGLRLTFPSCDMIWPIEEMPHDDVVASALLRRELRGSRGLRQGERMVLASLVG